MFTCTCVYVYVCIRLYVPHNRPRPLNVVSLILVTLGFQVYGYDPVHPFLEVYSRSQGVSGAYFSRSR